ncbi:unnamed protein product [Gongylonema pulchrum]|uniref:Uncharacterized protein n=1 Tax=Gongylonema pulchrum TaxID=637853 RepID=A0A183DDP2_9BILA|nr:unnamed protein product [Gongylonema pulchrum]
MDDEPIAAEGVGAMPGAISEAFAAKPEEVVMEVLLVGMGVNQARPMLLLLIDDMVSTYEMFAYDNAVQSHLAIRSVSIHVSTKLLLFAANVDMLGSPLCLFSFEKVD